MRSWLRPYAPRTALASVTALLAFLIGGLDTTVVVADQTSPDGVPTAQDGCAAASDPVTFESVDQVESLVVGTWVRCEGTSVFFGAPGADIGIEFTGDGQFHRIYRTAGGELIRGEGLEQQGRWSVFDATAMNGPGSYFVGLRLLGSGERTIAPALFSTPPTFDVRDPMTGLGGRHERWTGTPPVAGPIPGLPETPCGQPTGELVVTSVQQAQTQLVGSWTACGQGSVFGVPVTGELGAEFGADGSVSRLVRAPDGTVVRATGPGSQGTWAVIDNTQPNGEFAYQLNVQVTGVGTAISFPVFLQSPRFVRFSGMTSNADYLAGAPPPGQAPPTEMPVTGGVPVVTLLVAATLVALGTLARAAARRGAET